MRIIVNGQQAFGKAVLDALLERGEDIVAVYCAPEKEGARADPLREAAEEKGLPLFQPPSYKKTEVWDQLRELKPDLSVMAFVTLFIPEEFLNMPTHGTIQYHPSLLPKHRGASAINWTVIQGETKTGLTIFWPDRGLDTGPVLLQKEVEVGPDDTVGSLYFNHLFPLGVDALAESVALVQQGQAPRLVQDESQATYEPIFKDEHANIDWSQDAQTVYNLVRGSTPAPGANTAYQGTSLQLFESKLLPGGGAGRPGEVLAVDDSGIQVALPGGVLLVERLRAAEGGKVAAAEYAREAGIKVGDQLG